MNRRTTPGDQDATPAFSIPTYYSDSRGRDRSADPAALVLAVETLIRLATDRQTECAILVSTKGKVGRGTEFEKVVGQEIARRLIRGEDATLKGTRMRLLTRRGQSGNFDRGPVLALYLDPTEFKDYFEEGRVTDLIFVPWTPQDKERFLRRFADAQPL
jgi:hypothetical protein